MIIILAIFGVNILWAVWNWKKEWDAIRKAYKNGIITFEMKGWKPIIQFNTDLVTSCIKFVGDLFLTTQATVIFGFAGFYGSAIAIFMSNVLSFVFFIPRRKN